MTQSQQQEYSISSEKLEYDILELPLNGTYTDRKIDIIAKYVFVLQIPITVNAKINDRENPQVDLASVRAFRGNITQLFITTTTTSSTSLKILTSNEDFFSLISFGDVVKLIDPSSVEYDARLAKHDVYSVYDDRPADGNAHDTDTVTIQSYRSFVITVVNGLDVDVDIKYYVSSDGVNWYQLGSTTTVTTGTSDYETLSDPWTYFKVNYDADGLPTSGDLTINIERRS